MQLLQPTDWAIEPINDGDQGFVLSNHSTGNKATFNGPDALSLALEFHGLMWGEHSDPYVLHMPRLASTIRGAIFWAYRLSRRQACRAWPPEQLPTRRQRRLHTIWVKVGRICNALLLPSNYIPYEGGSVQ